MSMFKYGYNGYLYITVNQNNILNCLKCRKKIILSCIIEHISSRVNFIFI